MHITRIKHNLLSSCWYLCLEFAMKCLDQVETALKRWAPGQFRYLEHSSGFKRSRRSVRNAAARRIARKISATSIAKSEAKLTFKRRCKKVTMCEVEYMEGNNKLFCDRRKTNTTDTVLRTAISTLPDMLVLSLKPFDLDYNT
jgi:ubiquitin carboxyl-terminal hydrolase 9/24